MTADDFVEEVLTKGTNNDERVSLLEPVFGFVNEGQSKWRVELDDGSTWLLTVEAEG